MLRRLLAVLLARAGSPVSVDTLIDVLWQDAPPPTARRTLNVYVSRLRSLLGDDDRIETSGGFYTLRHRSGELDSATFRTKASEALATQARGDVAAAGRLYSEALGLWRGPAFDGLIEPGPVETEAHALEQLRLTSFEEWVECELVAGRHTNVIARLDTMIAMHPFRERLRGQRMIALYRDGRQAEALETYRRTYQLLDRDLGVRPNEQLTALHRRILAGDPELLAARAPEPGNDSRPRSLPRDIPDFIGRHGDLAWLDDARTGTTLAVINAISGIGGIGKTALAVHWAHRVSADYPDGQLYLDLRGYQLGQPMSPLDALRNLLQALGFAPDRLPQTLDQADPMFRSALAGRKMLILLDNARHVDQVRPLLPSNPECLVVVTSRDSLSGLIARDGARRLTLGTLLPQDALDLLTAIVGADRVDAEPEALGELAALCGYLPLALRIAAVSLVDNATRSIRAYVDQLREGDRISELVVDDDPTSAIRSVFGYSYRALTPGDQSMFRMIGRVPGTDFTTDAVVAMSGATVEDARTSLARLRDASLLLEVSGDRLAMHDLLREYAVGLSLGEDAADARRIASRRLLAWYLGRTEAAAKVLYPTALALDAAGTPHTFVDAGEATGWLEAEQDNLRAAVEDALCSGQHDLAYRIFGSLRTYLLRRRAVVEILTLADLALERAEVDADSRVRAMLHIARMDAFAVSGQFESAIAAAHRCREIAVRSPWPELEVGSLNVLGFAYSMLGDLRSASSSLTAAIDLLDSVKVAYRRSTTLNRLGIVSGMLGDLTAAAMYQERALQCTRDEAGGAFAVAVVLSGLAVVYREQGQHVLARRAVDESLELQRSVNAGHAEAIVLVQLAKLLRDEGDLAEAQTVIVAALATLEQSPDDANILHARLTYGTILAEFGQFDAAVAMLESATALGRPMHTQYYATQCLITLGLILLGSGHVQRADTCAREALDTAVAQDFHQLEGAARALLGAVLLAQGQLDEACESSDRAQKIFAVSGHHSAPCPVSWASEVSWP